MNIIGDDDEGDTKIYPSCIVLVECIHIPGGKQQISVPEFAHISPELRGPIIQCYSDILCDTCTVSEIDQDRIDVEIGVVTTTVSTILEDLSVNQTLDFRRALMQHFDLNLEFIVGLDINDIIHVITG